MKIVILKGDGIGPEIIDAAKLVMNRVADVCQIAIDSEEYDFGGIAFDRHGDAFPEETRKAVKEADAVLLGAVGGDKWNDIPREKRPETALLSIRKELGLFCNIRPIVCRDFLADRLVLKPEVIKNIDFVIYRELTGGIYFGEKKREGDAAYDIMSYTKGEIERIVREAFQFAQRRPRKHLTSIDKANVLETSRLWREVVEEVALDFPEVTYDHLYVDNAAAQIILNPAQFDVMVTENSFGDILSDEAAVLAGSLGMLASASIGGEKALYEPAHGSAPELAGMNTANPIATILSVAMMFRYTFADDIAGQMIEDAVDKVLNEGYKTIDIADESSMVLTTQEMGEKIASYIV